MPSTINVTPGSNIQFTALIKTGAADANLVLQTNGANAVVINGSQMANFVSTGAVNMPAGTTAQRPNPAVNGMMRYNTTTLKLEGYANNTWVTFL
jgi:hypothetical protein